jgi:hypothetical protein
MLIVLVPFWRYITKLTRILPQAKSLPDVDARVQFLSQMYRLASEFEMEGRIAPYDEEQERESDDERLQRLDLWTRALVELYLAPQGTLERLTTTSPEEKARFLDARAAIAKVRCVVES